MKTFASLLLMTLLATQLAAQPGAQRKLLPGQTRQPATRPVQEKTISLNVPNLDLRSLTDLISQKLSLNIIYDDKLASKRITIKTLKPIPQSHLLPLLKNVLAIHSLSLIEDKQGFLRIVQARNLAEVAALEASDVPKGDPVIELLSLSHLDATEADKFLKPFLTPSIGSTIVLREQKRILVIDFDHKVLRIKSILKRIDQPSPETLVKFIPIVHQEASALATQVQKLLQSKAKLESRSPQSQRNLELTHDVRTNQLILVGTDKGMADAMMFIKALDVSLGLETKVYSFTSISAGKVDNLAKELIGELKVKRLYKSALDEDNNLLIATTTNEIHSTIQTIRKDMDVAIVEEQSPVRFYKLLNTKVTEILTTLQAVEGSVRQSLNEDTVAPGNTNRRFDGINRLAAENNRTGSRTPGNIARRTTNNRNLNIPNLGQTNGDGDSPLSNALTALQNGQARITADVNTNTLIVVAPPRIQQLYAELIKRLDKRRPQVLCDVILVALDTTDDFSLGVEISGARNAAEASDNPRLLQFSNFGFSEIDPNTGAINLGSSSGFNGAIIGPDVGDIIIRALQANTRARVIASPRILVNDNATGDLTSVNERPFTSVSNSEGGVESGFGGFASAGTTISITPNISEGEHLLLEYTIDFSSFGEGGGGGNDLPPPRQTNQLSSNVTVPDGHTVIVGGLNRQDTSDTVQAVPVLGELPGWLSIPFKNTVKNTSNTTLFVFIKPTILRDDNFEDLKFISEHERKIAKTEDDFPTSEPIAISVEPVDK